MFSSRRILLCASVVLTLSLVGLKPAQAESGGENGCDGGGLNAVCSIGPDGCDVTWEELNECPTPKTSCCKWTPRYCGCWPA
jgi:hypothetical protein